MVQVKKHYGRGGNPTFHTYEKATERVQQQGIQSRKQYRFWVDARYRKGMPKNPEKVYDEWSGWNAFLGNQNSFGSGTPVSYREFSDALLYARKSGITTFENWVQVKHPDDIPVRSDIVYKDKGWKGWKYFLGTGKYSTTAVVENARKEQAELWWIVSHHLSGPGNVLNVRAFRKTDKIIPYLKANGLTVVRAFKNHHDLNMFDVLERHGTPYDEDDWLVENLNEAVFDISLACV